MQTFYSGADEFNCIIPQKQKYTSWAVKVKNNFVNITFDLDLIIYRKSTNDFSWFVFGLETIETEIFPSCLNITKIVRVDSRIIGFSKIYNFLYETVLILDETNGTFIWNKYSKIELFENLELKLTDIGCSNAEESEIYVIDDNSGIYIVRPNNGQNYNLELLFRLDNNKIHKIVCGFDHTMVLTDTGAIYSWGIGSRGQLGHCEIVLKCQVPKRVDFFDDLPCTIVDIACGGWHALALTSDGDIYSWGWNESGQLGHSEEKMSSVVATPYPVDLGSRDNPVIAISVGSRHSAALLKNGTLFTWGWNKYGQLSLGDNENRSIPTLVKSNVAGKIVDISCTRWGTIFNSILTN